MIDLATFRKEAEKHGICKEYAAMWDNCRSKKALWDIACRTEAIDYLCRAISGGWSMDAKTISKQFSSYCNGRYVYNGDYTSAIFCNFHSITEVQTTVVGFLGCRCVAIIPAWHICQLYISSDTEITIDADKSSRVVVHCYGGGKINIKGDGNNIKIKYHD